MSLVGVIYDLLHLIKHPSCYQGEPSFVLGHTLKTLLERGYIGRAPTRGIYYVTRKGWLLLEENDDT